MAHYDNSCNSMQDQVTELKSILKGLTDSAQDNETIAKITAQVEGLVTNMQSSLSATGDKIVHQTKDMAYKADQYVHEKPWQVIAISAGVGMLLACALKRSNNCR